MNILDDALAATKRVHEFFGYVEDWKVIPLASESDATECYWTNEFGTITYCDTSDGMLSDVINGAGDYYRVEVYKQRHLPKWEYRAGGYAMFPVDTQADGNKLLMIFSDALEMKPDGNGGYVMVVAAVPS